MKVSGPTSSRKPNYGITKFSIFLVYSCFSNPKTLAKIDSHMGILTGWNSPKCLSKELCEYILNNYDNSDYVTIVLDWSILVIFE